MTQTMQSNSFDYKPISGLMKELEPEAEYKPEPGPTLTNYTSTVLDNIKKQVSAAMQSSPPPYK